MLYIIRGLPGSGKSTLAQKMLQEKKIDVYYEADMYFINKNGEYNFIKEKIPEAHEWCQDQVRNAVEDRKNVAVSNVFVTFIQVLPYVVMADVRNTKYEIIECKGRCESIHNVPQEEMQKMKDNWERMPLNFLK